MSSIPTRSLSRVRASSHANATVNVNVNSAASSQPPALVARIEEKKAELEHLQELRQLSAAVAHQMEVLEGKLGTLSDGTEAIAAVVGNWHNVLRAINMASTKLVSKPATANSNNDDADDVKPSESQATTAPPLPQTLVRIPTEHAPTVQAHADTTEQDVSVSTA